MAFPNYTYLKLKMPGPNGVITVGSTYRHAYECNMECVEYAKALTKSEALIADLECLTKEVPDAKRHAGNFEPAEAVKFVPPRPQQRRLQASRDRLRARPQIGSSARRLSPRERRGICVESCHTRISGHQDPGANIITRCAGTKSHTYDESWHRIECYIFTI
jgi:hypothetical protein